MDALVTKAAYDNFINSIRTEATKERYAYLLNRYMKFLKLDSIDKLLQQPKVVESFIIHYIIWLKNEEKLSQVTINQYIAAIMHFYSMNDITLNRKKIGKYIVGSETVRKQKDRAYTNSEIRALLEFCDERSKALVLLLSSSGIRIGSVSELRLIHLKKIKEYALYSLTIYEGTREEYFTFCTPEAAKAIDTYLDSRVRAGEKLTDNAPLFRKQFDTKDFGAIRNPKFLTENALSKLIEDKLLRSGITTKTHETESSKHGQKRNPVQRCHGFRKFVETNMIRAKLQPEPREMLLGHDLPSNVKSYYRPEESELLEEYLKAVDLLTINEENRLRREVETLKVEKSQMDRLANSLQRLRDRLNLPDE
jgi:integrase